MSRAGTLRAFAEAAVWAAAAMYAAAALLGGGMAEVSEGGVRSGSTCPRIGTGTDYDMRGFLINFAV